jgi:hypothetical protein
MPARYRFILEALAIASVIIVVDLLFGLVVLLGLANASLFLVVSNALTIEFGAMLIIGGCLMARQPLMDEKRYDSSGKPTAAWRFALLGKQVLLSSIFLLLFALMFALAQVGLGI